MQIQFQQDGGTFLHFFSDQQFHFLAFLRIHRAGIENVLNPHHFLLILLHVRRFGHDIFFQFIHAIFADFVPVRDLNELPNFNPVRLKPLG